MFEEEIDMLDDLLKSALQEQKIVSIYRDPEDSGKCFTGFVGAIDEDEVLIYHLTPSGMYDGYILVNRDDIFQVDYDGRYEKKIEFLSKVKKQSHEEIEIAEEGILHSLLSFAQEKGFMTYIGFEDSSLTGLIRNFDDKEICLDVFTNYGESDGISAVSVDAIEEISVDSVEEQDILLLKLHL